MYFRGVSLLDSYEFLSSSAAGSTKDGQEDEDGTEKERRGGSRRRTEPPSITRETKCLGNCTQGTGSEGRRADQSVEINKGTVAVSDNNVTFFPELHT